MLPNALSPGLAYQWNFTDNRYADIDLSPPIYRPIVSAVVTWLSDFSIVLQYRTDHRYCISAVMLTYTDISVLPIWAISANTDMPTLIISQLPNAMPSIKEAYQWIYFF